MRLNAVYSAAFVAALALSACDGTSRSQETVAEVPSLPFDSLFTATDTVPLWGDAANAVGFVGSMALNRSRVFIADPARSDIKVFDRRSGTLLGAIGVPGDGPGRFLTPSSIALVSVNRIVASDLGRNVLSVWDTNGYLGYESGSSGFFTDFTPIAGTTRVLAGGYYAPEGQPEVDSLGRRSQLHEVDYMTGQVVGSYVLRAAPAGHPWARVYATPRATLVGTTAIAGTMSSNVLWLHDRVTGREREITVTAPWYRPPTYPADTQAHKPGSAEEMQAMERWSQQQYMLSAILPLATERFLMEFVTGADPEGRRYHYIVADTSGKSLFSTQGSDVRLLIIQDTMAHGVRANDGKTKLLSYRISPAVLGH